jgi:hypothetical protein
MHFVTLTLAALGMIMGAAHLLELAPKLHIPADLFAHRISRVRTLNRRTTDNHIVFYQVFFMVVIPELE